LFKPANVSNNVNGIWKPHDRVTNQLTWSVPSYLATAININHLGTISWAFGVLGALSCGIGAHVLKQDASIWPQTLNYFFVDSSLKGEPFKVGHEIGI
jgi:hypothetical protein